MRTTLILLAAAWLAAGCGGGTTASSSPAATAASPSAGPSPSAAATSLDPCQLVTASEASALAGATYTTGTEQTTAGGPNTCVYGAQTLNVFSVLIGQASDAAAAQAAWTQEQAAAQAELAKSLPQGVHATVKTNDVSVAGADRAAVGSFNATISGQTIGVSVIYLLKGADFLTFSDLAVGHAPPSASAMEAQASISIGRLP